ncbi:nucleotidyltransferase family protein [Thermodesulfobacteriota bacterium]
MEQIGIDSIILAGGRGKRLRRVIKDLPKPLAQIGDKPFLDILLDILDKCPLIKRVVLAVSYRSEMIISRYKDNTYSFKIDFSIEKDPLGTGGAVKKALSLTTTSDIIVLNGDTFTEINYQKLIDAHRTRNSKATIVLHKSDDTIRYGCVEIDSNLKIIGFKEKAEIVGPGYINAGIYVFQKSLFDVIPQEKVLSLETDIIPYFIKGDAYAYITEGKFIDIGIPESYFRAIDYLRGI